MKEIGGYFELEVNTGSFLHEDALAFNTGTNCLAFLIKQRNIRKIYLPIYACSSIKDCCKKFGLVIKEYSLDASFRPMLKEELEEGAYLYIINYYGQLNKDYLNDLKKKYDRIIIDNVQAYFEIGPKNCDCIYSTRKYFGLPDGAFLYTDPSFKEAYDRLEYNEVRDNMFHLLGRFEGKASDFYEAFRANEEKLAKEEIKKMSLISMNILKGIDYENVGKKREDNFRFLDESLSAFNKLKLSVNYGAYIYPLMIDNASVIRERLIKKGIYLPLLWPNVLKEAKIDSFEYNLANSVINIACDQRYDLKDMKYICKLVMEEMGD